MAFAKPAARPVFYVIIFLAKINRLGGFIMQEIAALRQTIDEIDKEMQRLFIALDGNRPFDRRRENRRRRSVRRRPATGKSSVIAGDTSFGIAELAVRGIL
ncbi:MAG: hypothetical protein M0C28_18670 [Candidatus Moduliflexus flocculans]|nr:hypothetical protein [Candidatus Moduliflexus flocculans]